MKTFFLKIFIQASHISETQKVQIVLGETIIFSKISNRLLLGWLYVTYLRLFNHHAYYILLCICYLAIYLLLHMLCYAIFMIY